MTSDCPAVEFVGSSWRRDQHARKGSQHCMHCHSAVNARGCTLRPEWQCHPHCHSTSNVPRRRARARVAVPTTRGCALRAEWQCHPHCHSTSNVPKRCAQGRVAVRVRVASGPAVAAPMPGRTSRTCLERVDLEPCSRQTLCGQWNVSLQGRSGWLCSWPARCSQPPSGWHDGPSLYDTPC